MYSTEISKTLLKKLQDSEYDAFFAVIEPYREDELLTNVMNDFHDEWRKLNIAKKNGLMDDTQINYAMIAYFKRKNREIFQILDSGDSNSGNLNS